MMWKLAAAAALVSLAAAAVEHPQDCSDPATEDYVYNFIKFQCGAGGAVVPVGCNSEQYGGGDDVAFGSPYMNEAYKWECSVDGLSASFEIVGCMAPGGVEMELGRFDNKTEYQDPEDGTIYQCWKLHDGRVQRASVGFRGCWVDGVGYERNEEFENVNGTIMFKCRKNANGYFSKPSMCLFENPNGGDRIEVFLGDYVVVDGLYYICDNVSDPVTYEPEKCIYVDSGSGESIVLAVGQTHVDSGTGTIYGCDLLPDGNVEPEPMGCYGGEEPDGTPFIDLYLRRPAQPVCPPEKPIGWCGINDTSGAFELRCMPGNGTGNCYDNNQAEIEANGYFVRRGIRLRCDMVVYDNGTVTAELSPTHCAYPLGVDSQGEPEYKLVRRRQTKSFYDPQLNETVVVACQGERDNLTMVIFDASNATEWLEYHQPERIVIGGGSGGAVGVEGSTDPPTEPPSCQCVANEVCVDLEGSPYCACEPGFYRSLVEGSCKPSPCGCPPGSFYGPPLEGGD